MALTPAEKNEIVHRVPFLRVVYFPGRYDVMNYVASTKLFQMLGFGATAVLALVIITFPNCSLLCCIPSGPVGNFAAFPTGVVLPGEVLGYVFSVAIGVAEVVFNIHVTRTVLDDVTTPRTLVGFTTFPQWVVISD